MTRRRAASSVAVERWWLDGDETCGHCLQRHALELQVHCTRCDEPACWHCIVEVRDTSELACPTCEPQCEATGH